MTEQKDYRIELYRFIFAVIIMIFHAHNINNGQGHPIPLGHVFVEFFFFLTGYFTYSSLVKEYKKNNSMNHYPLHYTVKKFKRFIPYLMMTATVYVAISMFCNHFIKHLATQDSLLEFSGLPFDVLLLQVTGICKNPSFNAWWYLSAILFTLPIVIVLFYKKICSGGGVAAYIIYFVPILIYGAFSVEVNGLDWDREVLGILKSGIFRGFAGLCVGCTIYDLRNKLVYLISTVFQRVVLTIIEVASYLVSILIAWKWSAVENSTFLIVLLLVFGLVITLSSKSYTTILNKKIFAYMGSISLPLYICHYSIGRLIGNYFMDDNINTRYLLYYISSFTFAICMIAVNKIIFSKGVTK